MTESGLNLSRQRNGKRPKPKTTKFLSKSCSETEKNTFSMGFYPQQRSESFLLRFAHIVFFWSDALPSVDSVVPPERCTATEADSRPYAASGGIATNLGPSRGESELKLPRRTQEQALALRWPRHPSARQWDSGWIHSLEIRP